MTTSGSDAFKTPPECTLVVRRLLLASDEDFEDGITRLDVRVGLIQCSYLFNFAARKSDRKSRTFYVILQRTLI